MNQSESFLKKRAEYANQTCCVIPERGGMIREGEVEILNASHIPGSDTG